MGHEAPRGSSDLSVDIRASGVEEMCVSLVVISGYLPDNLSGRIEK